MDQQGTASHRLRLHSRNQFPFPGVDPLDRRDGDVEALERFCAGGPRCKGETFFGDITAANWKQHIVPFRLAPWRGHTDLLG